MLVNHSKMKKLIIILLSVVAIEVTAQDSTMRYTEEGVMIGANRMGIDKDRNVQPMYGITFQQQYGRYLNAEVSVLYSQAESDNKIRDYLNFMILAKPGYFSHKAGIYGVYGGCLHPSLNHNNSENHTYGSLLLGAGMQLNVTKKKIIDAKIVYSQALSGGYLKDGEWSEYSGLEVMVTFKIKR